MISSSIKKGRPKGFYQTTWDVKIDGLTRLTDGRWKVSGPIPVKFTEADERLAVARALEIQGKSRGDRVNIPTEHASMDEAAEAFVRRLPDSPETAVEFEVDNGKVEAIEVSNWVPSPAVWKWFRTQLLERPKYVAKMVGIEQLSYLGDLKPDQPSVKLSALIDAYASKPKLSPNEVSRSRLFWAEFTKAVKVSGVRDIGHPQIIAYEKAVLSAGRQSKSVHHRFAKIKTVLAYGLKRGLDTEGCRKALDAAAMLDAQHRNQNDPTPIDRAEFWKVYNAATKAGDTVFATLVLTALNAAMYGGEVAALKWGEVDLKAGTLVTRRPKTGVSRVAVLWPETVAALKAVTERDGVDYIFNTRVRSYTTFSVLEVWRRYCDAASLPTDLKFGSIRDAAYTIACQSASLDQAKALAGHRFPGMADAYVRRRPDFVAMACAAIRDEFIVKNGKKKP